MIRQPSFTDETDAHVGATEAKGSAAKAEKTTATSKKREDVVSDDDGFAMPSLPTKAKSFHIKSSVSQASSTFFANSGGTAVGSGFKMPGALPVDTDVLKREVELLRLKLKKGMWGRMGSQRVPWALLTYIPCHMFIEQDMRIQLESKLDRESKAHLQLKMEHQLVVSQLQQARKFGLGVHVYECTDESIMAPIQATICVSFEMESESGRMR